MTLCTIGYERRSIDEYVEILRANGVEVVLDVRETAWSHKPGFSKSAFAAALAAAGIRYVHARFAGNPKWLRSAAVDHAEGLRLYRAYVEGHPEILEALDATLRSEGVERRGVALTCFERHHDDCHRSILAEAWARRHGAEVSHLESNGCKRHIGEGVSS